MAQYKYTLSRRYSLNFHGNKEERNPVLFPSISFQQSKDPLFNVTEALKELNDREVPMDDPTLIRIIRDYFIELPSLEPYNLKYPNKLEYSKGQTPFIDSRLNNMVSIALYRAQRIKTLTFRNENSRGPSRRHRNRCPVSRQLRDLSLHVALSERQR